MPACRVHGTWPCLRCKIIAYKACVEENLRGANHDLKDLRQSIIELGGQNEISENP